jgi:small subunit ribosomal protein S17
MSTAKTTGAPSAGQEGQHKGKEGKGRQQRIGRVTSDKMQKTIVVAVETLKRHPLYRRTYKSTNKFKTHDEHNDARIGDMVRIEETRPLSKDKRWRLVEIVKRAEQVAAVEQVEAALTPSIDVDEDAEGEGEE